jgi:cysteine desulfurase family protein
MIKVYADNAATSFPKPVGVSSAMCNYIDNIGGNVGRGTYQSSFEAGKTVFETRELLCELFNAKNPLNVIFTSNITESLNVLIKGSLRPNDHVIITSMEHNAVMRPLNSEMVKGIEVTKINCDTKGYLDITNIEKSIKSNTRLIVMTHSSNVSGTIMPIEEIGELCKKHSIFFVIDSAQSGGVLDIDMYKHNLSALPFTGHKGLMGPQGIGGFIIKDDFANYIKPLKEGGTGSYSEHEIHPNILPDKFECGTLNVPGIYGLNASLKFLKKTGIKNIREHESYLSSVFIEKISNMNKVILSGMKDMSKRTAVFSLNFDGIDNSEIGFMLEHNYGIMTRVGLHCAPSAHKTLGTFPSGSVRISFGYFNTVKEIEYIIDSIYKLTKL